MCSEPASIWKPANYLPVIDTYLNDEKSDGKYVKILHGCIHAFLGRKLHEYKQHQISHVVVTIAIAMSRILADIYIIEN